MNLPPATPQFTSALTISKEAYSKTEAKHYRNPSHPSPGLKDDMEEYKGDADTSESESFLRQTYTSEEMTVNSSIMERESDHTIDSNTIIETKIAQKYGTVPENEVKEEDDEESDDEWSMPTTMHVQSVQIDDKRISRK